MEKKRNTVFFWAFAVLWGALILWNAFTPSKEFSESENRYLQKFPRFTVDTLLNGKFMDNVNTHLNDRFAGRPYWVSAQSLIEFASGKREANGVYLGKNALIGNIPDADADITEKNIAGINAFAERYGIPVYAALIPGAAEIQAENLPAFASGWDERVYIERVYAEFSEEVTAIDVYKALWDHRYEYIYYRTDHHWTNFGAYLAYGELAAAMGFPASQPEDFSRTVLSRKFYGTYHSKTGFPLVSPDTLEVWQSGEAVDYEVFDGKTVTSYKSIYFDEFLAKKDKYSYLLGQVQPVVKIKTAAESGKKLIIFKDSYAHSLVPMLLSDYGEICLVDLRYTGAQDLDEFLDPGRYDEALFLYSTDVFSHIAGPSLLAAGM